MTWHFWPYGVAIDMAQAVTWLRKAATLGYMRSQLELGKHLATDGNDQAGRWLRLAADQGHMESQCVLGEFLLTDGDCPVTKYVAKTMAAAFLSMAAAQVGRCSFTPG